MRNRSKQRAKEMREYVPLMLAYLAENLWCMFPGCTERSVVVHHICGREGRRLLIVEWWRASCHHHNNYAETNSGHCLKIGWLLPATKPLPKYEGAL